MVVEALANLPLDLSDLFVECGDDLPNRGCNDGRVRRLCVHRLLLWFSRDGRNAGLALAARGFRAEGAPTAPGSGFCRSEQ